MASLRVRHFLSAHHGVLDLERHRDLKLSEYGEWTTVKCTQGRMAIGTPWINSQSAIRGVCVLTPRLEAMKGSLLSIVFWFM